MKGAVLLLDHFRFSTAFHALSKTEQNIHDGIKQRKVLDIYVSNRLSKIHQHSNFYCFLITTFSITFLKLNLMCKQAVHYKIVTDLTCIVCALLPCMLAHISTWWLVRPSDKQCERRQGRVYAP